MAAKKPTFRMQDAHKMKRLKQRWRRPRGKDSKMRRHLIGYNEFPSHGYSSPRAIRGKLNGLDPVIVANVNELGAINPQLQIAVLSSGVGMKTRLALLKIASEKNIRIFNFKNPTKVIELQSQALVDRKAARQKLLAKRSVKKEVKKEKESKLEETVSEEDKKKAEKEEKDKVITHGMKQ